jgi:multidrug resistance efflux pump
MSASPIFHTLRFVIVAAVLFSAGVWLFNSLVSAKSYKGYVNGKIIHLRPPIKGVLHSETLAEGMGVEAGQKLGEINNSRAVELEGEQRYLSQKIETSREQLDTLANMIYTRRQQIDQLKGEATQQDSLRVSFEHQNVAATQSELTHAKALATQAQKDAERYKHLKDKGFISAQQYETEVVKATEAKSKVTAIEARLHANQAKLNAAQQGFQVDSALSKNAAGTRAVDFENQLMDLTRQRSEIQAQLASSEKMLNLLEGSNSNLRKYELISPVNGVLWYVGASNDEFVSENSNVIDIVDCNNLWVDAYVDEQMMKSIDLSQPVKVRLLSHPELKDVKGNIMVTRSGVGRVSSHEGVALPNEREKSHALVRVQVQWPTPPSPQQSCYVGSSVETEFAKLPWWEDVFASKK